MTKSAHTRASLLPYPIIAAAVAGDAEAVSRVVRHYSSYIAALSTRTSYGSDGYPRLQVDEELRNRLEAKLIIAILDFDLWRRCVPSWKASCCGVWKGCNVW